MTVPGSWLCSQGYALREAWNTLQQNRPLRHVQLLGERAAWAAYDHHIAGCAICKGGNEEWGPDNAADLLERGPR